MSPTPLFILTPSRLATRPSARPALSHRAAPRSCTAAAPTPPTPAELETHFSRLNHLNKNLRVKASAALAESASEETIARLISLLSLSDTAHRRAAVQALGMTGMAAVPSVLAEMGKTEDVTVRASCAKVLAGVAMYFPEGREEFPKEGLDALEGALGMDADPVTKIASVGALGMLGCDAMKDGEGVKGCERAVEILIGICGETEDVGLGATAVGAISQIAQNGDEGRKERIVEVLSGIVGQAEGEEGGFGYIREIAAGHLDALREKIKTP